MMETPLSDSKSILRPLLQGSPDERILPVRLCPPGYPADALVFDLVFPNVRTVLHCSDCYFLTAFTFPARSKNQFPSTSLYVTVPTREWKASSGTFCPGSFGIAESKYCSALVYSVVRCYLTFE